jgi:hypothetical protein
VEYLKREMAPALKALVFCLVMAWIIGFWLGEAGIQLPNLVVAVLWFAGYGIVCVALSRLADKQRENDKINVLINSPNPTIAKKCDEVMNRAMSGQYASPIQKMADIAWLGAALEDTELAERFYQKLTANSGK